MRCLNRNKQVLYYGLAIARTASESTETVIVDGVEVPIENGDYTQEYDIPRDFLANITFSGNESTDVEFGVDRTAYDAIIVTDLSIPITETSLIWFSNEPPEDVSDGNTADLSVIAIKKSLNVLKAIVKKRVRQ